MPAFRDQVAAFLRANPNRWIPAVAFEAHGGRQAWRTRIAECRTQLGMAIDNRTRRVVRLDGTRYVLSEYRYVPAGQQSLLEEAS
jgi:hypothetical protein